VASVHQAEVHLVETQVLLGRQVEVHLVHHQGVLSGHLAEVRQAEVHLVHHQEVEDN